MTELSQSPPAKVPRYFWWLLLLFVLLGLGIKFYFDQQYRASQQNYQQLVTSLEQKQQTIRQQRDTVVMDQPTTQQALEAHLGITFTNITQTNSETIFEYIDQDANIRLRLTMDAMGRVIGNRFGAATPSPQHAQPQRLPVEQHFYMISNLLSPTGAAWFKPWTLLIWFSLYWVGRSNRHWREVSHFGLVTFTAICMVIWLMNPYYTLTPRGILSNDRLFWGVIMGIGTATILIRHKLRKPEDPLACLSCGYHLKANTTGSCPECGQAISPEQQKLIQNTSPTTA